MTGRELEEGMVRVEVVVHEKDLLEVQSILEAPTASEAIRILISNRLAAERAQRQERRGRQPRAAAVEPGQEPVPQFPKRETPEEDWQERRETHGERRWRKAGPVVEEAPASSRDEHPIRAYQRRVQEEEQGKERARRGGSLGRSGERPAMGGRPAHPRAQTGGRPGEGRPYGDRPGGRPGGPGGPGGRSGGPGGPGGRPGGSGCAGGRPSGPGSRPGGRPGGRPPSSGR